MPSVTVMPRACELDEPGPRGEIAPLPVGGETEHAHAWKTRRVEEVGIGRREKAAVLVAEDDQEAVEAARGERVEVARPVVLIVEAALPIRAIHRIDRKRAIADRRPLFN